MSMDLRVDHSHAGQHTGIGQQNKKGCVVVVSTPFYPFLA